MKLLHDLRLKEATRPFGHLLLLCSLVTLPLFLICPPALKSAQTIAGAKESKSASNDVDFGPYMAAMQKKVKRNWFPPKGNESDQVVTQWKIHKDGSISDLKVTSHTKTRKVAEDAALKAVENAALKAVENASPFDPLPDGAPDAVDIQFTFDYNVFNGSKKQSGSLAEAIDGAAESVKKQLKELDEQQAAEKGSSGKGTNDTVQGHNTASGSTDPNQTKRVNNLANLEALLNIIANGTEIQMMGMSAAVGMAGVFLLIFVRGRRVLGGVMLGLSPFLLLWGLAVPGIINWLVASARDANLFS